MDEDAGSATPEQTSRAYFLGLQASVRGDDLPIMISRLRRWIGFLLLTNKSFRLFRWFGVHVTPVHFYSPIPDLRELEKRKDWGQASEMAGVDMNTTGQRECMEEIFPRFMAECDFPTEPTEVPHEFYVRNEYFGYVSAAAMHCFVRFFRPRTIVDVGAGSTTRIQAQAALMNARDGHPTKVIAVDPNPGQLLRDGFPGLTALIPSQVQTVNDDLFVNLRANDILSIDTSHVVRTKGDVVYLFLEILPRLQNGVIVHIHDIFLPFDYPLEWLQRRHFWSEQYICHAFMIHNQYFEIIWAQNYAEVAWPELYQRTFLARTGVADNFHSRSLWLRCLNPTP